MRLPSDDISGGIYQLLNDNLIPVEVDTTIDFNKPSAYIGEIANADLSGKRCFGSDNAFIVEVINDYQGSYGNWHEIDQLASSVVQVLTENKLPLNDNDSLQVVLIASNQIEENLENGRLRYRRVLRFSNLTFEI